jgi:hypothetical protein
MKTLPIVSVAFPDFQNGLFEKFCFRAGSAGNSNLSVPKLNQINPRDYQKLRQKSSSLPATPHGVQNAQCVVSAVCFWANSQETAHIEQRRELKFQR